MGFDGFRAVKHDLLELKDAASLYVAGEPDAQRLVLLCAGFPCDHSSFIPLAARLANECGCLVGVSCMPEFRVSELPLPLTLTRTPNPYQVSCMPEFDREGPPLRPQGDDLHP